MKRVWLALGLACLVCCLPLFVPFLGTAAFAGLGAWAGGLNGAEIACLALIAAGVAAAAIFWLRRRRAAGPACQVRD
jgi:hypothetical protein